MRRGTRLAGLARGHVVQHVLHGAAVRQTALRHLAAVLSDLVVPPLTLVSVEQEDQLLLDELPLLGVGRRKRWVSGRTWAAVVARRRIGAAASSLLRRVAFHHPALSQERVVAVG